MMTPALAVKRGSSSVGRHRVATRPPTSGSFWRHFQRKLEIEIDGRINEIGGRMSFAVTQKKLRLYIGCHCRQIAVFGFRDCVRAADKSLRPGYHCGFGRGRVLPAFGNQLAARHRSYAHIWGIRGCDIWQEQNSSCENDECCQFHKSPQAETLLSGPFTGRILVRCKTTLSHLSDN